MNRVLVDTTAGETALYDAIASAPAGAYLILQGNEDRIMQAALQPPENSDFTLDLNGHTLMSVGPFVGSVGTETNAFRFLKGSNITIKNGTLKCQAPGVAILIQNFANLTLDNVKLQGKSTYDYIVSNNYGEVHLKNGTTLPGSKNPSGQVSFDAHYGLTSEFDEGVSVYIDDPSVVISGRIEYTKESRISDDTQWYDKCHIYIPVGYTGVTAPDGYQFQMTTDGKHQELVHI